MRVAIIEDEEILLKVLKEKFEKANFDVTTAINGEEAASVIRKHHPDIIILDLVLPQKSGFEVLRELKSDAELKTTPIIVLSNLGQDDDIKKALREGADDYLVKTQHPINEVIEKVKDRLLSKSK